MPTSPTSPSPPSPPSDPITEYYLSREPYTTLLKTSHATLPQWRDPAAKLNRKADGEGSPFEDERAGRKGIIGVEGGEEEVRELIEKFKTAGLKNADAKGADGKAKGKAKSNDNAESNGKP